MASSPSYKAHLFVCTNAKNAGDCCAPRGAQELRDTLKKRCKDDPRLRHTVRINNSGCLDLCSQGVVAVLYPKGQWFTDLTMQDVDQLLVEITKMVETPEGKP